MKKCCQCGLAKPVTDFARHSRRKDGRQSFCRTCARAYQAAYARGTKESKSTYDRARRFNLTVAEVRDLLGRPCDACGLRPATRIDHDHTCCPTRGRSCGRCVRGGLCDPCNVAEGRLGTPAVARALADYMERTSNREEIHEG